MTTFMRSAAVAAVGLFLAFGTVACDDTGGGGGGGGATTTTSTTVSLPPVTTTTLPSTTTTTVVGPKHLECVIRWSATNAVKYGALQFDTTYTGGQFEGSGDAVICSKINGDLVTFNDNDANKTLSAAFVSLTGIQAPADLMNCNFNTPTNDLTPPVESDFGITIVDATDPDTNPVEAAVAISNIQCVEVDGPSGTTTTTSTSTTSTSLPPGGQFTIGFTMADAVTVGALQFSVDYSATSGSMNGSADAVECTKKVGDLVTFNDDDANSTLAAAYVALTGFAGPDVLLAECNFTSSGAPQPSDFVVTVEDATDPDVTPIDPFPTINVSVTPTAP